MHNRTKRTIVICDTDLDHPFTLEGDFRNHNYEVVNISYATELVSAVSSLHPSVVLANPDMQGFNENDVCKRIKRGPNIPVIFLMDKDSTHRAQLDDGKSDDVLTKPVKPGNLFNLVEKLIATHQS